MAKTPGPNSPNYCVSQVAGGLLSVDGTKQTSSTLRREVCFWDIPPCVIRLLADCGGNDRDHGALQSARLLDRCVELMRQCLDDARAKANV